MLIRRHRLCGRDVRAHTTHPASPTDGLTIEGTVSGVYRDYLVLVRSRILRDEGSAPDDLDGETWIERRTVAMIQVLG